MGIWDKDTRAALDREAAEKAAAHAASPEGQREILDKFRAETLIPGDEQCRDSLQFMTKWVDDKGQKRSRIVGGIDGNSYPPGTVQYSNHRSRRERLDGIRQLVALVDAMLEQLRTAGRTGQKVTLPENLEQFLADEYAKISDRDKMELVGKPKAKK